jgi:hypothetical protein
MEEKKYKYPTELCTLFEKYRADKVQTIHHNYSVDYFSHLIPHKEKYSNVLEIGIGNTPLMRPYAGENYIPGASIKAWRDFFPNATVYAIDILKEVLFEEERIKTYIADQGNSDSLENFITTVKQQTGDENFEFDFIIDDGSHEVSHQKTSINTLNKYLKVGGIYIIEDIASWWLNELLENTPPNMEILQNRGDFIIYTKNTSYENPSS